MEEDKTRTKPEVGFCKPPYPPFSAENQPKRKNGRKKGQLSLKELLKKELKKIPANDPEGRNKAELLILSVVNDAIKSNSHARDLIFKVEGSLVEKHEHSGPGGKPIKTINVGLDELMKRDPRELAQMYSEALSESSEA